MTALSGKLKILLWDFGRTLVMIIGCTATIMVAIWKIGLPQANANTVPAALPPEMQIEDHQKINKYGDDINDLKRFVALQAQYNDNVAATLKELKDARRR